MTHAEASIRNRQIIERTLAGESVKEIAETVKTHWQTVYRVLAAAGIDPVKKYKRTPK